METLGERVKHLRLKRRLTQRELAEKTGITRANIIKIEQSHPRIRLDAIIALANVFLISTDWLLLGDEKNADYITHGEDIKKQLQEAISRMEKLEGEPLQRVMDYILYESSNNSIIKHP